MYTAAPFHFIPAFPPFSFSLQIAVIWRPGPDSYQYAYSQQIATNEADAEGGPDTADFDGERSSLTFFCVCVLASYSAPAKQLLLLPCIRLLHSN